MSLPALLSNALDGLREWAAPQAVARLEAVLAALPTCADPAVLDGLGRALPPTVAALEPEVCAALAEVAAELVPHGPVIPRDLAELEPRLRIAWRRVELAAGAKAGLEGLDDDELLRIVAGWSVSSLVDPRALVERLLHAEDARLRVLLHAWILPLVVQLAMSPAEAFAVLRVLAGDREAELRAAALARLGDGWLRSLSPAAERDREAVIVQALVDPEVEVARAAIVAAAGLARRDWLLERVLDEAHEGPARAEALDALGPLAQEEDLDLALALAEHEPLRFAAPARRLVLAAHRHGAFIRSRHLDALLQQLDDHPPWTGEELVRVTYIVRGELVERLATLAADDPRWRRRASILAASVGTQAHVVLRRKLEQVRDVAVAQALVEAAGHSPEYEGEAPLLAWLDALPEVVIPVLRVKGGEGAEARLRARVLDLRLGACARELALGCLWALCRDRSALMRELGQQLGPHDSGLLDEPLASPRDPELARLVVQAPWSDEPHHAIDPRRRLTILCESGDIEQRPAVVALFREIFRSYVRRALAGDFMIKRVALPELEQQLFRYGRYLVKGGRSVRRFLEPGPETGRDLVLQLAVDWLGEEPASAVCVALLELIGRHTPGAATLRALEPLWRHGDREVRRAAIETILAAGEEARGLELSICRLAEHEEPRIMVQALAAVAALGAQWAEPMVLAALRRPEMAVKKEAAHALGVVGSARAVAPLVEWIAHHDNRGFREELLAALERAAGPSLVAVLVAALELESEARRIELLSDALSGRLSLAAALRLARSPRASHARLVEACLEGRVKLRDAQSHELAAQLHRAKLRPPKAPRKDPGRSLRIEGFSRAAARALIELRTPELESEVLATVRLQVAEWIAWLRSEEVDDPRVLAAILDAVQPQHAEHVDGLLELVERERERVDPGAVAGFVERCVTGEGRARAQRQRAITLLRQLPASARVGGSRRLRLLGRLGAVRTRADLERALDECRTGPDFAREAATLLREALRIPGVEANERPEITAMREVAERWHVLDDAARERWLTAMLAERPLDLPLLEPRPRPTKPRFEPSTRADLEALLATLRDGDEQERTRAATRLLDWPDAQPAWPQVLAAFLRGAVQVSGAQRIQLALLLDHWPSDRQLHPRADELFSCCTPRQQRVFVGRWIEAWLGGEGDAALTDRLRGQQELLLPHVWAAAERGELRPVHLLEPNGSVALRHLVAWVGERSPADVEHLRAREPEPAAAPDDREDPLDPLAGRDPDELVAVIETKGVESGLAVRAIHALVAHGERGVAPLERFVVDPRAPVRSAALRALRRIASRPQSLDAAARALAIETRRDVVLQLMKSLGHGRHEPSLPALLERLEHGDPRLHEGAHAAIRGWGQAILPALRRAARRARPDRRPRYAALVLELEQIDD